MATFEESFCFAEEEALGFLVTEHGFSAVRREVVEGAGQHGVYGLVVYQRPVSPSTHRSEVSLSIAPLRLELDLCVKIEASASYSVEELYTLQRLGAVPPREHGLYEAMHNPNELLVEFERLAAILRAAGGRFFSNDQSLWPELQAQREAALQAEEDQRTLAQSEQSFRAKDWSRVVALLGPLSARLSKAASARLSYAQRKTAGET
jgi:hypothetical protein